MMKKTKKPHFWGFGVSIKEGFLLLNNKEVLFDINILKLVEMSSPRVRAGF